MSKTDSPLKTTAAASQEAPRRDQPPEEAKAGPKSGRKSSAVSWLAGFIFYAALIALVIAVYILSAQDKGRPRILFGYSMFIVQTGSMQSEIPQESFILVKAVDPATIAVGDDVTYMRPDYSTVTHKVVNIYEDYMQSGLRGFQTKGVENQDPDADIVYADNVLGVVIYHNLGLGSFLSWLRGHVLFAAAFAVALIAFVSILRYLFRTGTKRAPEEAPETVVPLVIPDDSPILTQDPSASGERNEKPSTTPTEQPGDLQTDQTAR